MELKTKGIIIDAKDYKEYDKIVTILTFDKGVINAVVKGVKKNTAKMRFAGQLFCFVDFVLSKKGGMYTVISADLIESFFEIAYDYDKYLLAVDLIKVVRYVSRYNPDSTELFVLFLTILNVLLKTKTQLNIVYTKFLVEATKNLGYAKNFVHCAKCGCEVGDTAYLDAKTCDIYCHNCIAKGMTKVSGEALHNLSIISRTAYSELEDINLSDIDTLGMLNLIQTIFKLVCN